MPGLSIKITHPDEQKFFQETGKPPNLFKALILLFKTSISPYTFVVNDHGCTMSRLPINAVP
ncbi:MAG TPA: hypothetical protein DCQ58_02350 [Saprospirales bacterium]|nr:hypothetical protein [Saprospirales bacterium]